MLLYNTNIYAAYKWSTGLSKSTQIKEPNFNNFQIKIIMFFGKKMQIRKRTDLKK